MPTKNRFGAVYRRRLPHYRTPGSLYHVRFSVIDHDRRLTFDWMFEEVEKALFYFHRRRIILHAYVIMPNHVHAVLKPLSIASDMAGGCDYRNYYELEAILKSLKGYTSRVINKKLGMSGSLWLDESFDRTIRNEKDLIEVIDYIHHNPVRWGMVRFPREYRWSSAATIYSGKPEYSSWFDLP